MQISVFKMSKLRLRELDEQMQGADEKDTQDGTCVFILMSGGVTD